MTGGARPIHRSRSVSGLGLQGRGHRTSSPAS